MWIFLGVGGERWKQPQGLFFWKWENKMQTSNELEGDLDYPFWGDQAMQRMHGRISWGRSFRVFEGGEITATNSDNLRKKIQGNRKYSYFSHVGDTHPDHDQKCFGWFDQILPHLLFCFPKNHAAPSQSCWKHTHMPLWWLFCLPIFPRLKSKSMFKILLSISKYSKVKGKKGSQILLFHHLWIFPQKKNMPNPPETKNAPQHFKKEKATETPGSPLQKPGVADYRNTWMHDPLPRGPY